ncbi:formate transporter [Vibrio sp. qd031]|uniref:formate transporter FocA n=1 Tax=Vibrio sp. qd031 TaxID=1603038 RepID=UPI000A10B195|nr:formate transporter FocA [Vibrio sp. qd031]ORT48863.1 formate transporter [Vibrio sp. qd031]
MDAQPVQNELCLTPKQMMEQAEQYALGKSQKPTTTTLLLAVMAGAFIGLAFLFYITVTTGSSGEAWGLSRFVGGIAFGLGLVLVVLCGAELFTSSVLSAISLANKQINLGQMLSLWGKAYVGNFVGAITLAFLVFGAGLYNLHDGAWGLNALTIADHKLHHSFTEAFILGVLCNLLVCLAIWLTFSSKTALGKSLLVLLPVSLFVSSGFEHSIANMFMVPLGIAIVEFAPASFWQSIGMQASQFTDLNVSHFIVANLIPVTLGNIVGGAVLVGLTNWVVYRRPSLTTTPTTKITPLSLSPSEATMTMSVTVKEILNPAPITVVAGSRVAVAIDKLNENNQTSAPVINQSGNLVGFFSLHDVMVEMWCTDYRATTELKVEQVMSSELITVDADQDISAVIEYLCIDKEQLYPTSSMGYATRFVSGTLSERAHAIKVSRPKIIPVIEKGEFIGTISHTEIQSVLRPLFGATESQASLSEVEDAQMA